MAYVDNTTMVLPTNCDEAPRLPTNLHPRLCNKWASAASTVWAMDSILHLCRRGCSFNSDKFKSLSVQDEWCAPGYLLPAHASSLSTRPCLQTSKPQTVPGARVRQPSAERMNELPPGVQTVQSQSVSMTFLLFQDQSQQRIKSWIQIVLGETVTTPWPLTEIHLSDIAHQNLLVVFRTSQRCAHGQDIECPKTWAGRKKPCTSFDKVSFVVLKHWFMFMNYQLSASISDDLL